MLFSVNLLLYIESYTNQNQPVTKIREKKKGQVKKFFHSVSNPDQRNFEFLPNLVIYLFKKQLLAKAQRK